MKLVAVTHDDEGRTTVVAICFAGVTVIDFRYSPAQGSWWMAAPLEAYTVSSLKEFANHPIEDTPRIFDMELFLKVKKQAAALIIEEEL